MKLFVTACLFLFTFTTLGGSLYLAALHNDNWGWFLFIGLLMFIISASVGGSLAGMEKSEKSHEMEG